MSVIGFAVAIVTFSGKYGCIPPSPQKSAAADGKDGVPGQSAS